MPTEIAELSTLREAAERRDWNACRDAVEALLSRLPAPTIIRLAHAEVQRRLPVFERHHPHMRWPRLWLDALATGASFTFDESAPEVLEESTCPGGNNFTEAVQDVARAATATDRAQCVNHAIEAIGGAIVAELGEIGGSEHRDLWELWYREGYSGEERSRPHAMVTIMADPKVVAADLAAWNRLADELAAALGVKG